MINIASYVPETILLLLIVINSMFLTRSSISRRNVTLMNIIFILGLVVCSYFIVREIVVDQKDILKNIFKLYVLTAAIYFTQTYSRRFKILERLCILSLCIGSFLVLSSTDIFTIFTAVSLCILSVYGIAVTREHPSRDAITLISFLLITAILYGAYPFLSTVILLITALLFCLRTTNSDLEALTITVLTPVIIYMLLRELLTIDRSMLIASSLTTIGVASMTTAAILLMAHNNSKKNMAKFAIFYIGVIVFMVGCGTLDIKASALTMMILLTFVYSPIRNPMTILTLAILPPTAAFIAKIPLFWAPFKTGMVFQMLLVITTSLLMAIFSGIELYRVHISKENNNMSLPIALKVLSITAIILSVIYFDWINITLEQAIKAIGR